ncbi:hypothetical protein [Enterococcus faecium]|uniref:hypothetical protein n=1 Tax=Enterococcus faecium TaxID=1352 RepID=UPI000BF04DCE|nr:hypothetical protein [Enterococcus faecium]PEH49564.1 hypothetical protein CRM75_01250 [Enterococcus faecium]
MSLNKDDKRKIIEAAGAQELSYHTRKKFFDISKRFRYHFPSLNWYGNTPIDPTGAGLTEAEAMLWISKMLHHLSDWMGKFEQEINNLQQDLIDLNIVIKNEMINQLPDIITEYDLFDIIVTGNNEHIERLTTTTTTLDKPQAVFSYAFKTEYGFITASKKTQAASSQNECGCDIAEWVIHVDERQGTGLLNYFITVTNIPISVNRIWIINKQGDNVDGTKEVYYINENEIYKAEFNKTTIGDGQSGNLAFSLLNTNYNPQWIINVFERVPKGKNYLHYLTDDYKCWEYDLDTGDETFLWEIPIEDRRIFDPISDVIEGKNTVWAITYKGTVTRFLKEMNGLCVYPCFDSVEMYDKWETPKKVIFSNADYQGITPANQYQEYADNDEQNGDKSLISAFLLTERNETYAKTLDIWEMIPRNFDKQVIAENIEEYFKDSMVKDLYDRRALIEYQGFFSYDITDDIVNFTDAPELLYQDALGDVYEGAKIVLENSQFVQIKNIRTFWQRLKIWHPTQEGGLKHSQRIYERTVQQEITENGIKKNDWSRWYDATQATESEVLDSKIGKKLDYLSIAGTHKIYNMKNFENQFEDTPVKVYKYYDNNIDATHPLFSESEKKNVIIDVTKGTSYGGDSNQYEIVIKLTYQDDWAELQFRRTMRFDNKKDDGFIGGRTRATFISAWAYVYYTVDDDSAPDEYDNNPNIGIDIKFQDIINNLQNQINNINNEINDIKGDITNINNQMNQYDSLFKKILEQLEEIGVWIHNDGDEITNGDFVPGKGIAGGNINVFSKEADGDYWIRTNSGKTENDLLGGV